MFRMTKIFQLKKEFMESAGLEYRWSFFDVVFEVVRVERYEKIMNQRLENSKRSVTDAVKKKIQSMIDKGNAVI
jgi:hypothetical protein